MLTITTQDKTTAVAGFAKNQNQVLEVMALPVIKAPISAKPITVIDRCLDALAALAMSEILADSNQNLAGEYLNTAQAEAYALGREMYDGTFQVPMMLKAHPKLSAAFLDGQDDEDETSGGIVVVRRDEWTTAEDGFSEFRAVVGKNSTGAFIPGWESCPLNGEPSIVWGDAVETEVDALKLARQMFN